MGVYSYHMDITSSDCVPAFWTLELMEIKEPGCGLGLVLEEFNFYCCLFNSLNIKHLSEERILVPDEGVLGVLIGLKYLLILPHKGFFT